MDVTQNNDVQTREEFEALLKQGDPTFKPASEGEYDHPYRKVDSHTEYPELDAIVRGKSITYNVLDTHINLMWMLKKFDAVVKNNLMKRRWEVELPDQYIFDEDAENSAISRVEYLATINKMPTKKVGKHIKMLAEENSFHPIVDCLNSNPWDGIPRLDRFIKTLHSTNDDLTMVIVKTWMCAAVAAIFTPGGFACQGVLVLQGPQKVGKTSWIKQLDPANCDAVREAANLDPAQKDDILRALEYWIVELGELDSTFKKDIARLKAFITASSDHIRNPYAYKGSRYFRRTIFAASVNSDVYLVDDTGNRRWWTVSVTAIDFNHGLDMKQVWAEVYALWRAGHKTDLSNADQDRVNEHNTEFEKIDPVKEKILDTYDWGNLTVQEMTASSVLEDIGFMRPSRADATRCGMILKEIIGDQGRLIKGVRKYPIPVRKSRGGPRGGPI